MNKLKLVIIIEAVIILVLALFIFVKFVNDNSSCSQYFSKGINGKVCLLSPRVYTGIISPESYLILNFNPIKEDIQNYIHENNLNASVYVVNLRDSASFGINSNESYAAASLNKIPIAVLVMKKVEEEKLTLDTKLSILETDRDSSSGYLYLNPVNNLSVKDLIYYMLTDSDNTAAWVLQKQITKEDLESLTEYLDYYSNDIKSEQVPLKVTETNPKTVSNIFISLYLSTILEPKDSELILSYMTNTSFDINKYAKLPPDVVVSQKVGFQYLNNEDNFFHSCGIMYIKDSRIFYCVMTKDIDTQEDAQQVVGTIVNKIYKFVISNKFKNTGINP